MPVRDSGPRTRLALPDERPVIAIASRGCASGAAANLRPRLSHQLALRE